jgi:hypothetical protein
MKIDKEVLIKQKFWVIAGASAFVTLIAFGVLLFITPRSIAKQEAEVEGRRKGIQSGGTDLKNQAFVDEAKKVAEVEKAKESKVWKAATRKQQVRFFWPPQFEKEFEFLNGLHATEIVVQGKDAKLESQPPDQPDLTKKDEKPAEVTDRSARDPQPPSEDKDKDKEAQEGKGARDEKAAPEKGVQEGKGARDDKGSREDNKDNKGSKEDKAPPDKSPRGEPAPGDGKAPKAEEPEEAPIKLFHGRLVEFNPALGRITVVGRDNQTKIFHRAPQVKVTGTEEGNKPSRFDDLFEHVKGGDKAPSKGALVAVKYFEGRRFYDGLTDAERKQYAKLYASQLLDVLRECEPQNMDGVPLVQFPGWQWDGKDIPPAGSPFFHYVTNPEATPANRKGARNLALAGFNDQQLFGGEEPWLAQEDLWIQKELFRLVKKANDSVADFKQPRPKVFANPYWMLEQLDPDEKTKPNQVRVRLTNLLPRTQPARVSFRVQLEPNGKFLSLEPIEDREALLPLGSPKDKKNEPTDSVVRNLEVGGLGGKEAKGKTILAVRQMLTWDTAAVKRIDFVAIGTDEALSQRNSFRKLEPFEKKSEPAKAADEGANPADQFKGGVDPKVKMPMPGVGGGGKPMPGDPSAGTGAGLTENHKLVRDRYFEVTPQSRRVPVSIVLIVDQAHAARVQTAFADSPMRFLTNQVLMTRAKGVRSGHTPQEPTRLAQGGGTSPGPFFPGTFPPGKMPPGTKPPGTMPPVMMPGYQPGAGPPSYRPPGGMMVPPPNMMPPGGRDGFRNPIMPAYPGMPGSPGETAVFGGDDQESNIELVLYGVVTLYERYPLRPPLKSAADEPPPGGDQPQPNPG